MVFRFLEPLGPSQTTITLSGFVVRNLPSSEASEWFYILNISALLLILDFSVPNAVSRINSTNYAKGNKIKADEVDWTNHLHDQQ